MSVVALANLVAFNTADSHRRQLGSSHTRAAVMKRTRTQFGKLAFSACVPKATFSPGNNESNKVMMRMTTIMTMNKMFSGVIEGGGLAPESPLV